jgi:AcrR family transcriptional regulator
MNKRSGIESKKRIMNAAMHVFSVHGYERANIREISKIAGISVGGVYLYFRNKEELYVSFMQEMMQELTMKTGEIIRQAASPSEALAAFLRLHINYAIKHKELILVHFRELGFAFGMDAKQEFFRRQRKEVGKIITNGIRAGEFRKCNVRDVAKIIMGALRGTILSMAVEEDGLIEPKRLIEFVLNGLVKYDRQGRSKRDGTGLLV